MLWPREGSGGVVEVVREWGKEGKRGVQGEGGFVYKRTLNGLRFSYVDNGIIETTFFLATLERLSCVSATDIIVERAIN